MGCDILYESITWVVIVYTKVSRDHCSLETFIQHKPNWSKVDVIILIEEFYKRVLSYSNIHYWGQTNEYSRSPLLKWDGS